MAVNKRAYAFIFGRRNGVINLLAFKQQGQSPEKPFHIPGGGIDQGETPRDAVIREIEEESGLQGLRFKHFVGSNVEEFEGTTFQRYYFIFEAPGTLPETWRHKVTGTGKDSGITYEYHWLDFKTALRLHQTYLSLIHTSYFHTFFAPDYQTGLPDKAFYLLPYSKQWPAFFEAERDVIKTIMGDHLNDIYHVGSTAVETMVAIPVIDMALSYLDGQYLNFIIKELETIGYQHYGPMGVPGRQLLKKAKGDKAFFQIQIFHSKSIFLKQQLQFTQALRTNQTLAKEFVREKLSLWGKYKHQPNKYAEGKRQFVLKYFQTNLSI